MTEPAKARVSITQRVAPTKAQLEAARPIPGFDGYLATAGGEIITLRLRRPAFRAIYRDKLGYRRLTIRGRVYGAFSLVCAAFHGPRPSGLIVRHLDGTRDNDTPENLRWGTISENSRDSVLHGTCSAPANAKKGARARSGELNGMAKMTLDQVIELRNRRASGETYESLAGAFGITRMNASLIARHKRWKYPIRAGKHYGKDTNQ